MTRLIIRRAVIAEITDAAAWYHEQRPDLGPAFLLAVAATLDRVVNRPESFPVLFRDLRRAWVGRPFPYAVYFRVYDDVIAIAACVHARRDPRRWQVREPAAGLAR